MILARLTGIIAIYLGVIGILGLPISISVSEAGQNARVQSDKPQIQKRQGETVFDPSHPAPVSYEDNSLSLRLDSDGAVLAVIVKGRGEDSKRVLLPQEMAQVNEIRRATKSRAVVLGMMNGDVSEVVVLDIGSARVSDSFFAYEPTLSPDGRYVAFIKFYPPHSIEGPDDRYMLYDLSLDASQNRPRGLKLTDRADVGVTVYPPGKGNREGDNTGVSDAEAHANALDSFFWSPNSDRYLFADNFRKILTVVSIRVSGSNPPAASIVNISQDELCASVRKKDCDVHLSGVNFETPPSRGVTVHFRGVGVDGSLKKDFHFDDPQFEPVS